MERLFHLQLTLHLLLLVCTYSRRVQHRTADSESHAVHRGPAFMTGQAASASLAPSAFAAALSTHRSPQMKVAKAPRVHNAILRNHIAPGGMARHGWRLRKFGPTMHAHLDAAPARPVHIEHIRKDIRRDVVPTLASTNSMKSFDAQAAAASVFPSDILHDAGWAAQQAQTEVDYNDILHDVAPSAISDSNPSQSSLDVQDGERAAILPKNDLEKSSKLKKTQENLIKSLRTLLYRWSTDAERERDKSVKRHDNKVEKLMSSTLFRIQKLQNEINMELPDHVLGFVVGETLEDNIQAMASVTLDEWYSHNGASLALPAQPVPVVCIGDIVTRPDERQEEVEDEVIYSIIAWSKQSGRLVTINPPNEELVEYYKGLGFQRIDTLGTMVYLGSQEASTPSRGRLVDLL